VKEKAKRNGNQQYRRARVEGVISEYKEFRGVEEVRLRDSVQEHLNRMIFIAGMVNMRLEMFPRYLFDMDTRRALGQRFVACSELKFLIMLFTQLQASGAHLQAMSDAANPLEPLPGLPPPNANPYLTAWQHGFSSVSGMPLPFTNTEMSLGEKTLYLTHLLACARADIESGMGAASFRTFLGNRYVPPPCSWCHSASPCVRAPDCFAKKIL
jgi:hypothetical protein